MIIINEDVVALQRTLGGKFQNLIDSLNKYGNLVNDLEAQFGQLGLVYRVEKLLERSMSKTLGWNVRILSEITPEYVKNIHLSTVIPTIVLSRKFTTDFIKAIKQGDCKNVLLKLKNDLKNKAEAVYKHGEDPFTENLNYIIIEASTAGGCFHAALPVDTLSLVDTDDDQSYIAKETKKDHFILEPTKEFLQKTLIKALDNKKLTEKQRQKYLDIIKNGNYRIIKERLQESNNKNYKIIGNRVIISSIYKEL